MPSPEYTLYSYFRSSCSARLRIALNLKNLPYETIPVNLLKDEQSSSTHKALNPSGTVPLLICHNAKSPSSQSKDAEAEPLKIGQSLAALEYLEDIGSQPALLPPTSKPELRAAVRTLAAIIACDTQPMTNLRVTRRVQELGRSTPDWNLEFMTVGLQAYEDVAKNFAGKYSVGDELSIADCCLVPAVWNAERFGVDVGQFETVSRVVGNLKGLEAVKKAGYLVQPDTPKELRVEE